MKCQYCVQDRKIRQTSPRAQLPSYRVKGVTNDSCWEWFSGVCNNPTRCWGLQIRRWTVLKASGDQWVFRSEVSEPNEPRRSSLIDEIRVTLQQGSGANRLLYSGVATGKHCRSFWPAIPGNTKFPVRKVIVKMRSGEPAPLNGHNLEPEYVFPNHILFRYFEQPKIRLRTGLLVADKPNYPETEIEIEDKWNEISKQYVFMYPGGSGFRVEQYIKIEEFMEVKNRIESPYLPNWFKYKNGFKNGFIPDVQGGWIGPILSYHSRVDSKSRSYW